MRAPWLLLGALLCPAVAFAQDAVDPTEIGEILYSNDQARIQGLFHYLSGEVRNSLSTLEGATAADLCGGDPEALSEDESRCIARYSEFFGDDPDEPVDIRVAFGYSDGRPADIVLDPAVRAAYVEHLTEPCVPGYFACGFTRDPHDMNLLRKTVTAPDGTERTVEMRVSHSAGGLSDSGNRGDRRIREEFESPEEEIDYLLSGEFGEDTEGQIAHTAQGLHTRASEENFFGGIGEADALIYMGHARKGGGPDFSPPRLDEHDHVQYETYEPDSEASAPHRESLGSERLMRRLSSTPPEDRPQFLGMFACKSEPLFGDRIREASPQTGTATNGGIQDMFQAYGSTIATVDSLLGMRCQQDFDAALHDNYYESGFVHSEGGTRLTGLF